MTPSRSRFKDFLLVIVSTGLALAAVEAGFRIHEFVQKGQTAGQGFRLTERDPQLGYKLRPSTKVTVRRSYRGETLYNPTYTVTDSGYRFTKTAASGPAILMMGCSFTFGEGVNDAETLAAQLAALLPDTRVVNLGVPGYGPHQVLRELELSEFHGVRGPMVHVVHEVIQNHVRRTAGHAWWDLAGPRYRNSGDSVVYSGPFRSRVRAALLHIAMQSAAFKYYAERLMFSSAFTDQELETYGRIVERAGKLSKEKLGADFVLLYWDEDTPDGNRVTARLKKTGLPLILVSQIIPRSEWDRYLYPHDHHPMPAANAKLATYLAAYLSKDRGTSPRTPAVASR